MKGLSPPLTSPRHQSGAALVIGLILLLVLTILAVSGVVSSTLELRMAGNQQQQERAFQAAEVAVEQALASPMLSTTAADVQALTTAPGSTVDQYEYRLEYAGEAAIGPGLPGYSLGSSFTAYHFAVDARGVSTGGAESRHAQGFYIVGPDGS